MEKLLLHRGQCVSRVELLESVWKMDPAQTTNIVDVYVNYLRRKLKDPSPGAFIRTVRGQGYMVPAESDLVNRLRPFLAGTAGEPIPQIVATQSISCTPMAADSTQTVLVQGEI